MSQDHTTLKQGISGDDATQVLAVQQPIARKPGEFQIGQWVEVQATVVLNMHSNTQRIKETRTEPFVAQVVGAHYYQDRPYSRRQKYESLSSRNKHQMLVWEVRTSVTGLPIKVLPWALSAIADPGIPLPMRESAS